MVNKKEKIAYYFFDKPKEWTRSMEVLKQFLDNAKVKSLQSDCYVGYVFLDGEYSIDNNICERNIRPVTVERKNSLSFASEEGIECSATYHTIVQTCRMMKVRVLRFSIEHHNN